MLTLLCAAPAAALAADAVIASVVGGATLTVGDKRVPAAARAALPPGGRIATGDGASVIVLLADGSKLRVGENSVFVLDPETPADVSLQLLKGFLTGWIRPMNRRRLNIRTPSAVASVRGTVLSVAVLNGLATIDLFDGAVWVTDRFGRSTVMSPAQRVEVMFGRGLAGTSSLPAGVTAPPEPVTNVPPPGAKAAQNDPKGRAPEQAPPETGAETPPPAPTLDTAPPPPPAQEKTVVSPSAP